MFHSGSFPDFGRVILLSFSDFFGILSDEDNLDWFFRAFNSTRIYEVVVAAAIL